MNVILLYLMPLDARETFTPFAQRWAKSYLEHKAGTKHTVYVAFVNDDQDTDDMAIFDGIDCKFINVESGGFDIGATLEAIKQIECDFLVTGTSRHFYIKPHWLKRMVEARKEFGEGLYGAMASLEANSLIPDRFPNHHLRTAFYGFNPEVMKRYPYKITNREQAYLFESGEWNFSEWFKDCGYQVRQVAWDGCYTKEHWTVVKERFRVGNQSNILISDKHVQAWVEADPDTKRLWSKRAWG